MNTDVPIGKRFTHVYFERGEPAQDSPRVRHRIGGLIAASDILDTRLKTEIEHEIGIPAPWCCNLFEVGLMPRTDIDMRKAGRTLYRSRH
jgi:hypothetical protein